MVADPLILGGGDLKISDQNNWGGPNQKIKFGGAELNFREGGGGYEHRWYGGSYPPFLDQPPYSRNPRCPHLS